MQRDSVNRPPVTFLLYHKMTAFISALTKRKDHNTVAHGIEFKTGFHCVKEFKFNCSVASLESSPIKFDYIRTQ